MTKSKDCSDAGTSQESGMHLSWRRQGVQLLQGNPAIAITLQSYGRGQFGPSATRQAHSLLDSGSACSSMAMSQHLLYIQLLNVKELGVGGAKGCTLRTPPGSLSAEL